MYAYLSLSGFLSKSPSPSLFSLSSSLTFTFSLLFFFRFGFDNLTGYYANRFNSDVFAKSKIITGAMTLK